MSVSAARDHHVGLQRSTRDILRWKAQGSDGHEPWQDSCALYADRPPSTYVQLQMIDPPPMHAHHGMVGKHFTPSKYTPVQVGTRGEQQVLGQPFKQVLKPRIVASPESIEPAPAPPKLREAAVNWEDQHYVDLAPAPPRVLV